MHESVLNFIQFAPKLIPRLSGWFLQIFKIKILLQTGISQANENQDARFIYRVTQNKVSIKKLLFWPVYSLWIYLDLVYL